MKRIITSLQPIIIKDNSDTYSILSTSCTELMWGRSRKWNVAAAEECWNSTLPQATRTWQPQMCPPRAIMAPRLPDFNVNQPLRQALSAEQQRFAQGPRPPLILSPRPHFVSLTLLTEMWRNSAVETLHMCSPSPSSSVWCGDICSFKSAVKTSRSASCVVHF